MNPADDPAELFVCGRLCLLGEHSDWAGGFRSAARPDTVHVGRCVVVGTNDGLRARVSTSSGSDMCVAMTSTDDAGAKRSRVFDLYDDEALLRAARGGADAHDDGSGTFWRYVAGTLHHLIVSSPHADAIAAALATKCVAIDNYETTLPMKKGLSSSAAACVLVVRAMSTACGLGLSAEEEMEAAYLGERVTPSKCGRMDQACAFGPGRLTLLTFDGETVDVKPLQKVGGDGVHVVVADLGAGKDTVRILDDLQRAYPTPRSDADRELHALLGENNSAVVDAAIVAIESGDAPGLGFVYQMAQRGFDEIAGVACPSQLGERGSPKLHEVLRCEKLKRAACGGKGVGSQGDGSVQFVCDGATRAAEVRAILKEEFGLADAMTIVIPPSTSA